MVSAKTASFWMIFGLKLDILLLPLTVLNLSLGSQRLSLFTVCVLFCTEPPSQSRWHLLAPVSLLAAVLAWSPSRFPSRNQLAVLRRSLAPQRPHSVIAVLLCFCENKEGDRGKECEGTKQANYMRHH